MQVNGYLIARAAYLRRYISILGFYNIMAPVYDDGADESGDVSTNDAGDDTAVLYQLAKCDDKLGVLPANAGRRRFDAGAVTALLTGQDYPARYDSKWRKL